MFITFEGIDSVGKSTQIEYLYNYIKDHLQLPVIKTFEPGDTEIGKQLREIILNQKQLKLSDKEILMLVSADRHSHIERIIKPALKERKIVLCDRFFDSTVAYQGFGSNLSVTLKEIETMINFSCDITPDLTLWFDMDLYMLQPRFQKTDKKDYMEEKGLPFFKRVQDGYKQLAQGNPIRIKKIDASLSAEKVHSLIVRQFNTSYSFLKGQRPDDKNGLIKPLTRGKEQVPLNNVWTPPGLQLNANEKFAQ